MLSSGCGDVRFGLAADVRGGATGLACTVLTCVTALWTEQATGSARLAIALEIPGVLLYGFCRLIPELSAGDTPTAEIAIDHLVLCKEDLRNRNSCAA